MQAVLKAGDRDLSSHVIAHAYEQCVEVFTQEALISAMERHTIVQGFRSRLVAVAYRNQIQALRIAYAEVSTSAHNAVARYSYSQGPWHPLTVT